MKELNDLLLADNSKEDNKAKQTLLLHLSKIQVTPEASLNFVRMCRFMDIDEELTSDIQVRMELSTKVITHKEVSNVHIFLLIVIRTKIISVRWSDVKFRFSGDLVSFSTVVVCSSMNFAYLPCN